MQMSGSKNQLIGIALLIALALNYVPVPFIDGRGISALIILVSAIVLLIVK